MQSTETPAKAEEERYDPAAIEPKWQGYWEEAQTFLTPENPGDDKLYVLDMFPYPSGAGLHVGHPEGYTATDIIARSRRARGTSVLHPMGWDAFGLPAEQHAIKTGTHPRIKTVENIATFRRQLKALGFSYDWTREVDTTDPDYVRWTQWIFLQLFHAGLAYQDEVSVNWCAALGTVLANEEVIDGKSERGGHPVERLPLRQWMLKITAYADRLLAGLEGVDWPNSTRIMQGEWIGRSEGAEVTFEVQGADQNIEVFTTRPDTLFGATFMVLAPEHPLVAQITTDAQREAVNAYVATAKNKSDRDRQASKEKTGVFTGGHAINPVSGAEVPIWVADYVLMGYGTGAIMAVPAHDTRDFEFAKAHGIDIAQVVSATGEPAGDFDQAFTELGVAVNSGKYDGMATADAKAAITADLEKDGKGKARTEYKLRDWIFSRQRYWGEPFPIYFPVTTDGDPREGAEHTIHYDQPIAVDESELPVRLPELEDYQPGDDPAGVLARAKDWRFFQKDGQWFARETNTMPQWAGSCWYYLRFCDPKNPDALASKDALATWLPVDLYVGGAEHAVLHLLYARFWHMVLYDQGHVPTPEPFGKLIHQGMILGEDNQKMSKSRGNVVNPDDVIARFGADTLRVYEMFMGPLEATKPWNSEAIGGSKRFLDRCWKLSTMVHEGADVALDSATKKSVHKTIAKVTSDIDELKFNTAISAMMVLSKELEKAGAPREGVEILAKLVHPFAPHLGEEMWELLGHPPSVQHAGWPVADAALLVDDEVEIPVQVNGKKRAVLVLAADATEEQAMAAAKEDPKVAEALGEGTLRKTIYVPKRILNLIIK
ncbi:MAG: leucine--tRNA ligase [Sandaracinus sp.]|nr:leucine--tRNA ligase [Sandaracinus sp.]|tara:strand:- start:93 stop:2576 length:2484 start_codon:yes stop_codon:yes gene_type:complete